MKTGRFEFIDGRKLQRETLNSDIETVVVKTDVAYRKWKPPFMRRLFAVSLMMCIVVSVTSFFLLPDLGYSYIKAGKDNTRHEIYENVQSLFGRQ